MGVQTAWFGQDPKPGFLAESGERGLRKGLLGPGRHYVDRFWGNDVRVYPWPVIPDGKVGVLIRLYGDRSQSIESKTPSQRGIVREPLPNGPHMINAIVRDGVTGTPIGERDPKRLDYDSIVEVFDPVQVPPGYIGIHTVVNGEAADEANTLVVEDGKQGVQKTPLTEGKYFLNPYFDRVAILSTLAARYSLSDGENLSILSKDGFRVNLSGMIEARLDREAAPKTFVLLNEGKNDGQDGLSARLDEELLQKVLLPNSVSFMRNIGASKSAVEIAGGSTRAEMQKSFEEALRASSKDQGLIVEQAGITKVTLPSDIASTLQARQIAIQNREKLEAQTLQEVEKGLLEKEKALALQKGELVEQSQANLEVTTEAAKQIASKLAQAETRKEVAEKRLSAAKDLAAATLAEGEAKAAVIRATNEAQSAKWRVGVKAFGGDGAAFADSVLSGKLGRGISSIMANSSEGNSPLMKRFVKPERVAPVAK
jgi:regulator of protease activity HflC (stomatin/prohibitin superfamily)